jgi:hypothetical protein
LIQSPSHPLYDSVQTATTDKGAIPCQESYTQILDVMSAYPRTDKTVEDYLIAVRHLTLLGFIEPIDAAPWVVLTPSGRRRLHDLLMSDAD